MSIAVKGGAPDEMPADKLEFRHLLHMNKKHPKKPLKALEELTTAIKKVDADAHTSLSDTRICIFFLDCDSPEEQDLANNPFLDIGDIEFLEQEDYLDMPDFWKGLFDEEEDDE